MKTIIIISKETIVYLSVSFYSASFKINRQGLTDAKLLETFNKKNHFSFCSRKTCSLYGEKISYFNLKKLMIQKEEGGGGRRRKRRRRKKNSMGHISFREMIPLIYCQ